MNCRRLLLIITVLLLAGMPMLSIAAPAAAGAQLPALPDVTVGQIGDNPISVPLQTLLLMTGITLLPSLLLVMTCFTRIIIVMALLRQAMGTGQTPSNQILVGLSLFLTAMIMMPVWQKAWDAGFAPYLNGEIDFRSAW